MKRERRTSDVREASRRSERRDAGTQRRRKRKRGQKKAEERRGERGARRRTEDERRGNEKRKDRAAPDSAALIFNDILGRAGVPLMHGHYNTLLSLSPSLSPVRYKGRVHACTPCAILPSAFSIGRVLLSRRSTEAS